MATSPSRFLLPGTEAFRNRVQGGLLAGILQQLHQPHDLPLLQQRVPAGLHSDPQVPVPPEAEDPASLLRPEVADSCEGNGKGSAGRVQARLCCTRILWQVFVAQGQRPLAGFQAMEPVSTTTEVLLPAQGEGEQSVK